MQGIMGRAIIQVLLVAAVAVAGTVAVIKYLDNEGKSEQLSALAIQQQPVWADTDIDSCWKAPATISVIDSMVKVWTMPLVKDSVGRLYSIVHVVVYRDGKPYVVRGCDANPVTAEDTSLQVERRTVFTRWAD